MSLFGLNPTIEGRFITTFKSSPRLPFTENLPCARHCVEQCVTPPRAMWGGHPQPHITQTLLLKVSQPVSMEAGIRNQKPLCAVSASKRASSTSSLPEFPFYSICKHNRFVLHKTGLLLSSCILDVFVMILSVVVEQCNDKNNYLLSMHVFSNTLILQK